MCGCCGCVLELSLCEDTDLLLLRLRLQQLVLLIIWRHLHHFLFLVDSVPPVLLPALLQQSHSDGTRKESQLVQLGEYSLVVFTWSHDPSPSHSHFYQGHKNREFLRRVKKKPGQVPASQSGLVKSVSAPLLWECVLVRNEDVVQETVGQMSPSQEWMENKKRLLSDSQSDQGCFWPVRDLCWCLSFGGQTLTGPLVESDCKNC